MKGRARTLWTGAALLAATGAAAAFILLSGGERATRADLARAYADAGEHRRAADLLRAAYRAEPSADLLRQLVQALVAAGAYEEALSRAPASSEDPAVRVLRAEALLRLGRFDEAGAAVAGERSGPYQGRALLAAARARHAQGDAAEADALLADALRAGGEALGEAWLFRARLALDANALADARAAAARAREAGAPQRAAEAVEIEALIRDGAFEAARTRIALIAEAAPRNEPLVDFLAAHADAAAGAYRTAARRIGRVERWLSGEPNGRVIAGLVRLGAGDAAQAERHFRRAAAIAPANAVALDALADFLTGAGRFDESAVAVEALASVAPGRALRRAYALAVARGDADGAYASVLAARGLPVAPSARDALFGSHAARPDAERAGDRVFLALKDAAAAQSLDPFPDDAVALAVAARLRVIAGEDRAAGEALAAALRLAPGFGRALEAAVALDVRRGDFGAALRRIDAARAVEESLAVAVLEARVLRLEGRLPDAVAVLRPKAAAIAGDPAAAPFYAALLSAAGDAPGLGAFAEAQRRAAPAAPATIDILTLAGLLDDAAAAAERALLDDPADPARREAFSAAQARLGAQAEAAALLAALPAARPRAPEPPASDLSLIRAAAADDPRNPEAILRLARAHAARGEAEKAVEFRRLACFQSPAAACPEAP